MTDLPRPYARHVYLFGLFAPDWRWTRATELVSGDPHHGRYTDDAPTLAAVRVLRGSAELDLADVRAARDVFLAGGVPRRQLEAYLLTDLTEAEIGHRTGLTERAVRAYHDLFHAVRGGDPLTRLVRFGAEQSEDSLVRAAIYGPIAIEAQMAIESGVGAADLPPGLVEGFERKMLMDRLYATNPAAYLRAVDRLREIDAGRPPGLLSPKRSPARQAKAGGGEGE